MDAFVSLVFQFTFFYPLTMSLLWIAGGLNYYLRRERGSRGRTDPPELASEPFVSILIPCHNEGDQVDETIEAALAQRYPNFEVIAINDGSSDHTAERLAVLAARHGRLRVIHLDRNLGKANAMRMGALAAHGEYLVCIDGDALLDEYATHWMLSHLLSGPRVGAVTGNPRIRNRTSLLGRMQVGEFSATIGLIKRTQQLWGSLFTVSGVVVMFRRRALLQVGFWAPDILTEDIDISWRLQVAGWRIRFQPAALAWILMPETIRGLWKQRLRWAMGGVQTIVRHRDVWLKPRSWRMWPVYAEYLSSVVWAYAMASVLAIGVITWLGWPPLPPEWQMGLLPEWAGLLLAFTCMLQLAAGMWIDRFYDRDLMGYLLWTLWYPLAFWAINMLTSVYAVPKAMLWRPGKRATWTSPDRGIRA